MNERSNHRNHNPLLEIICQNHHARLVLALPHEKNARNFQISIHTSESNVRYV